jgi:primosomal protein N' (replication factor Y)
MIFEILLPYKLPKALLYNSEYTLSKGDLVLVPIRNKITLGVVLNKVEEIPDYPLKEVIEKIPHNLRDWEIDFLFLLAKNTCNNPGLILKLFLTPLLKRYKILFKKEGKEFEPREIKTTITLTEDQKTILTRLSHKKNFQVTLLEGSLGSGKTELYLHLSQILSQEGQILILLPEILLSSQVYERAEKTLKEPLAIWNSSITTKEKDQTWLAVREGTAKIIFGTRSSLFLPFQKLRMIIIDEEQDISFKQENTPLYHAREGALLLAQILNIPVLLVSGTPSLETIYKGQIGQYERIFLEKKHSQEAKLEIKVLNLWEAQRKGQSLKLLHPTALLELKKTLEMGEQSLIFLNRKGYAGTTLCSACLTRVKCRNCSVNLTYYKSHNKLKCRHCGFLVKKDDSCTNCSAKASLVTYQPGLEKLLEELEVSFPQARIITVSRDSEEEAKAILEKITQGEVDIVIGTQVLAKGLHFSKMRLCIILDSYSTKFGGDIRALEKTYQVLDQVIGRVGRDRSGLALLQTFNKEDKLLKALVMRKKDEFLQLELENRRLAKVEPFWHLALITISSAIESKIQKWMKDIYLPEADKNFKIYGPFPANLYYLKRQYRYQILFKSPDKERLFVEVNRFLEQNQSFDFVVDLHC